MFKDKIDISLNCSEEIFKTNFALFIKNRNGDSCFNSGKKKLSGELNGNEIFIWYNPRCFNQPFSLPLAKGSFKPTGVSKTKIELDIYIEAAYPLSYLVIGFFVYLLVLLAFGMAYYPEFNFTIIEIVVFIAAPVLNLLIVIFAFRNSIKDTKGEIIKYLNLISRRSKKRQGLH